jgi:hypothetical protein
MGDNASVKFNYSSDQSAERGKGMKKILSTLVVMVGLLFAVQAQAVTIDLFEWAVNLDGTVYNPGSGAPGLNIGGFNTGTGLGTVNITFNPGAGGPYKISAFFDHEIDESLNSVINEYGIVHNVGLLNAGQTWEIDEPGYVYGDIYNNLTANTLDNLNGVPDSAPADVSLAMGWEFNLLAGQQAFIQFVITETAPAGGFYLQQYDPDSDASIYMRSSFVAQGFDVNAVPEPSTIILLGSGLAGLFWFGRKRSNR